MKNGKVEIGVAGCGWIAVNAHIPALMKNENVIIKSVFDICLERAKKAGSDFIIPNVYEKYDEFLDSGLDAVIIATPNYTHAEYTMKALKHKVCVLCEKPVALKEDELKEIINTAKENNVIYVPGFVNRWRMDISKVYELIKDGKLGEVKEVDGRWIRRCGVPRPGTWFTNRELSGGGVLIDLGSHIIDICSMFLGNYEPVDYELITSICNEEKALKAGAAGWFQRNESVKYDVDVEDTAIAKIKFSNEAVMNIKLSWLAPVKADYTYFKVRCSKGDITLKTLFGFSNDRLWEKDLLEYNIEGTKNVITFNNEENHTKYAFSDMLNYFVKAVSEKTQGNIGVEEALRNVLIIENLYKNEVVDEKECKNILMEDMECEGILCRH